MVFFTVVIQLLIRSGLLPALAGLLGTLLAPFGLTPEWAQRLLTGALELSTGVTTLMGDGSLSGRLVAAAFMLGWAGISVHCQVLSFLGGSGLSAGTYLAGKLLHGGLSALFTAALVRLFPLRASPAWSSTAPWSSPPSAPGCSFWRFSSPRPPESEKGLARAAAPCYNSVCGKWN